MRVQRAIRVILSALLMVTLCFCMIGCRPSEEELKNRVLNEAKGTAVRELERVKQNCRINLDKYNEQGKSEYEGDRLSLRNHKIAYEMLCDYMDNLFTGYKRQIETAETPEKASSAINDLNEYLSKEDPLKIKISYGLNLAFYAGLSGSAVEIVGETDDWISFTLLSGVENRSGVSGLLYFKLESSGPLLTCECISEKNAWSQTNDDTVIISSGKSTPFLDQRYEKDYGYVYFIFKQNTEIVGYAVVDVQMGEIVKAVTFDKKHREDVTEEKVLGYIENAKKDINGELNDGIISSECKQNIRYFYGDIEMLPWQEHNGSIFNKLIFNTNNAGNDTCLLECHSDDFEFMYKDEKVNKATLKGEEEEIYWSADMQKQGYIIAVLKQKNTSEKKEDGKEYFVRGFLLIRMEDHEEYNNARFVPESYMFYIGMGMPGEYIFDESILEIFIGTAKRLIKNGRLKSG